MSPTPLLAIADVPPAATGAAIAVGVLGVIAAFVRLVGASGASTLKINGRLFRRIEKLEADGDAAKQKIDTAERSLAEADRTLKSARSDLRDRDYQIARLKQEVNDVLHEHGRHPRYAADGSVMPPQSHKSPAMPPGSF